jgi:Xaa-Pro aminopeptidase
MAAVVSAIDAAASVLRPGVQGWMVDAAAREAIVAAGYPEYMHAVGHQVGRFAHDGGTLLGPQWERYGNAPDGVVEAREVYTLELGVELPHAGIVSIEEMVIVTASGCEFLTVRQTEMRLLQR